LERERERPLPHKKRVQCCTEAGVEREREGLVERERDAQALGAWGKKHPRRTSSHSLFSPKQTQRKSDHQSLLQKTKEDAVFSYNIHTPTRP